VVQIGGRVVANVEELAMNRWRLTPKLIQDAQRIGDTGRAGSTPTRVQGGTSEVAGRQVRSSPHPRRHAQQVDLLSLKGQGRARADIRDG